MTRKGTGTRKMILMVGEGVSSAHVIRPLGLAAGIDRSEFEVVMASDPRHRSMIEAEGISFLPLPSISPSTFLDRVYRASRLYEEDELRDYVRADLRAIAGTSPDVIVSDFRLSMGISAELCGIPHIALSNAHWSPSAHLPCPVPEHPLTRIFGVSLVRQFLKVSLPVYFGIQKKAINKLRSSYGLRKISGRGAQEAFTWGTRTLYLDIPQLYDLDTLAPYERFIGPVDWTPAASLPAWWDQLPADRPVVFLTPGSSGNLPSCVLLAEVLVSMGVTVMAATAGRLDPSALPAAVYTAPFIPAGPAAERSAFVAFNGGSAMVYNALARGTPLLGLPSNMDQYYVMEAVERKGAGRLLRSGKITAAAARSTVRELLDSPSFRHAAAHLQQHVAALNPVQGLTSVVNEITCPTQPAGYHEPAPALAAKTVEEPNWRENACEASV